ncbi:reverse transcriptase domain-containing protein [Tanacetum coccineum]
MCDASEFAVGAVLGQRIDRKFNPIYYASKTLNNAQEHYTITEKELLSVVFSFDKFCPYLILSKSIVYTDNLALKYLFSKKDAKPRLIRSRLSPTRLYWRIDTVEDLSLKERIELKEWKSQIKQ